MKDRIKKSKTLTFVELLEEVELWTTREGRPGLGAGDLARVPCLEDDEDEDDEVECFFFPSRFTRWTESVAVSYGDDEPVDDAGEVQD